MSFLTCIYAWVQYAPLKNISLDVSSSDSTGLSTAAWSRIYLLKHKQKKLLDH